MPMMPVIIALSSVGTSRTVNMDYNSRSPFNASVSAVFSSTTMTATYGIQYTFNDPVFNAAIGSTTNTVWLNDAILPPGATATGASNYTFPIAAVQCIVTAISSGSIIFTVMQG